MYDLSAWPVCSTHRWLVTLRRARFALHQAGSSRRAVGFAVVRAGEPHRSTANCASCMALQKPRTGVSSKFRVRGARSVSAHWSNRQRVRTSTTITSRAAFVDCSASHATCLSGGWATTPFASRDAPGKQARLLTRGPRIIFGRRRPKPSAKPSSPLAFASWSDGWIRSWQHS